MPRLSAQARARRIKLLLFDVDGVLTDGKLFFLFKAQGKWKRVLADYIGERSPGRKS